MFQLLSDSEQKNYTRIKIRWILNEMNDIQQRFTMQLFTQHKKDYSRRYEREGGIYVLNAGSHLLLVSS